jgi:hypothetical protein
MLKPKRQKDSSGLVEAKVAMSILRSIDWTFSTPFNVGRSGVRLFDCRKHHWYPATFIPEIPHTLIEVLTKQDAVVYDPFAGIGTTVFQALLLGRQAYGNELSAVAVMFMRSLWRLFQVRSELERVMPLMDKGFAAYDARRDYASAASESSINLDSLREWYNAKTFNQIVYLSLLEQASRDPVVSAAFRIALSATLKAVCAQQRGWGCIADNVRPTAEQKQRQRDAFARFRRNISLLVKDVAATTESLPDSSVDFFQHTDLENRIMQCDARTRSAIAPGEVDAVITSPPYPNMTDYATSQRLSHYWLGSDPQAGIPREIGARRKRTKPDALQAYISDMKEVLKELARVVKPAGYACFVMPRFEGRQSGNGERRQAIQKCMSSLPELGFVLEGEIQRFLPTRRRHHNQNWTSLEREDIFIYRRVP